jgi:hypothetical protein
MPYSLLIRISHKTISFSANKDGEGDFVPYGEPIRPLAVWFLGSSVTIGADAKHQALMGTSNAFYHIFDRMKEPGKRFEYANETHDYNKLLLYTIRAGVEEFLVKEMMNSLGQMEDNIGHLPILVAFGMDVTANERNVVTGQLQRNGFGNIKVIDEDSYLIRSLKKKGDVLVLSSDGMTLYGAFYKENKRVGEFSAEGLGRDPRVEKLSRLIWERTDAQNDWLRYEDEKDELEEAANKFLVSGKSECNESVVLSNGNDYPYYLQQSDLWTFNNNDEIGVSRFIIDKIQTWNGSRQSCCVFLKSHAVRNKYLMEQLVKEFPIGVHLVAKSIKEHCNTILLEDCRALNFTFQQPTSIPHTSEPKEPVVGDNPIQTAIAEPSSRDKRDFRMLKGELRACVANGDEKGVKAKCKEFLNRMHGNGIMAFDEDVAKLLNEVDSSSVKAGNVPNKKKPQSDTLPEHTSSDIKSDIRASTGVTATVPNKRDYNLFKLLKQEIQRCIDAHDKTTAKKKSDDFLSEMHAKGVVAFDKETAEMLKLIQDAVAPTGLDKRNMRILKSTISTLKAKSDKAGIQRECKKFLDAMHKKGIVAFDSEVAELTK